MGIKGFEVKGVSADDFVKKITSELSSRELGKIVSLKKEGGEILVIFSKLGTSEIRFNLESLQDGFKVALKNEKIAFAHKPFRAEMEAKLASVLTKNGAIVQG